MSKEHAQKFADIYEKVQALTAKIEKERQENRAYENETDPIKKDSKFNKYLSTTRDRIKHRGNLERSLQEQKDK